MPVLQYDKIAKSFWFIAPTGMPLFPGARVEMGDGRKFVFDDISPTNYTNIKRYKTIFTDKAKASKDAVARINEIKEEQSGSYVSRYRDLLAGTPYDHQVATIERMQKSDRLALLLEQGLGKTYIALMSLRMFKARDGHLKALVMCPAIVFASWLAEVSKFAPELKVVTYRGDLPTRLETRDRINGGEDFDILLTTYDMLRDAKNKSRLAYSGLAFSRLLEATKNNIARRLYADDAAAQKTLLTDPATLKPSVKRAWYAKAGKLLTGLDDGKSAAVKTVYPEIAAEIDAYAAEQRAMLTADDAAAFFNTLGLTVTIFDEASRLVSHKSHQSSVMANLKSRRIYLMSGTLCVGRPTDLYQPMRILDPAIIGMNWWQFKAKYCEVSGYNKHIITGYKNVDDLKNKLAPYTIDYKREDCLDLPDRTLITCYYELTPAMKKLYNSIAMLKSVVVDGKELSCAIPLQKIQKCLQVLSGFVHYTSAEDLCGGCPVYRIEKCAFSGIAPRSTKCERHAEFVKRGGDGDHTITLDACPKLEMLEDDLLSITPYEKVIVWAWFQRDLSNITALLRKLRINYITANDKDCALRFEADPNIRVFVGQTTQGIGITLNSATTTIYYSHGMGLEARLQSMDRNMRIGQSKPVVVRDYVCRWSIEEQIVALLQHKEDVKDFMQRNQTCVLCNNFVECLAKKIKKYGEGCLHQEAKERAETKLTLALPLIP